MKLYVIDKKTNKRIPLDINAINRRTLAARIGSESFYVKGKPYTINDVKATNNDSTALSGLLVGALVGLMVGPAAVVIAGTAGGFIGSMKDKEEKEKVEKFNEMVL